jgi:hypothetical protein
MELIQSFVWRRFILGLPTNALNKIFMRLYEDVDAGDYVDSIARSLMKKRGPQRFPKNAEVVATVIEKDFYNIKPKNRTYFLQRLENHNNKETVQLDGNSDITIEHIFPQVPDAKWKLDLNAEAYQAFGEVHLHTIGNLTLSGNNGSLGNRCFAEKKQMNHEAKEQGYSFSRLWLNRYLRDIDVWNLETYQERSRLLNERVLEIWRYPDIEISDAATNEEVSIFEAEDPTGRKLEYVVFADERRDVTTVSDLYLLVMRDLYVRNPEPFFAPTLRERLRLSKNANDCRNAVELHEGYFIESNLSSLAKFERIQEALTLFDAEDDLTIRYAN